MQESIAKPISKIYYQYSPFNEQEAPPTLRALLSINFLLFFPLLDKQTEYHQFHKPCRPGDGGGDGPVANLLLGFGEAHQVIHNPEVAVVEVGEEEGADAGRERAQEHAGAGGRHDGCADAGGGNHGYCAGALDKTDQGGDEERQHDDRDRGLGHLLGDVLAGAANLQNVAQRAARACYQDDDAGGFDAFFHLRQCFLAAHAPAQYEDGQEKADAHGDDGSAQEHDDLPEGGSGDACGGEYVIEQDQDDGDDQGQEGIESGGKFPGGVQGHALIFAVLFGANPAFAFIGGQLINLFAQPLGVQGGRNCHGQGDDDAQEDEAAHIHPKGAGHAQGAGGGGNQGVGDN